MRYSVMKNLSSGTTESEPMSLLVCNVCMHVLVYAYYGRKPDGQRRFQSVSVWNSLYKSEIKDVFIFNREMESRRWRKYVILGKSFFKYSRKSEYSFSQLENENNLIPRPILSDCRLPYPHKSNLSNNKQSNNN